MNSGQAVLGGSKYIKGDNKDNTKQILNIVRNIVANKNKEIFIDEMVNEAGTIGAKLTIETDTNPEMDLTNTDNVSVLTCSHKPSYIEIKIKTNIKQNPCLIEITAKTEHTNMGKIE